MWFKFSKPAKSFYKGFKVVLIAILTVAVTLYVILQLDVTQQYITKKAALYISGKTKTNVTIGEINIGFPKTLVLKDLYIEDASLDTLFYSHSLRLNMNMWALLAKRISVSKLQIDSALLALQRPGLDSLFNYDPVVTAFTGGSADTSASPWGFSMADVQLNNIRVRFFDQPAGTNVVLDLGRLILEMPPADFKNSPLQAEKLEIRNSKLRYSQGPSLIPAKDSINWGDWGLVMGQLDLSAIEIHYKDQQKGQVLDLQLGEFSLVQPEVYLSLQQAAVNSFSLKNSSIHFTQSADSAKTEIITKTNNSLTPIWQIRVNSLRLENNLLSYDDFNSPPVAEGLDLQHFRFSGLSGELKELDFAKQLSVDIRNLTFLEEKGFNLQSLNGKLAWSPQEIRLEHLSLQTARSSLKNIQARLSLLNSDQSTADLATSQLSISLDLSEIAIQDIVYFYPKMQSYPVGQSNIGRVTLAGNLSGTLANLDIVDLNMQIGQDTRLVLVGGIQGLPVMDSTFWDLQFDKLETSANELHTLLGDSTGVPFSKLPVYMAVTGTSKGSIKNFTGHLNLKTTSGDGQLDLVLKDSLGISAYSGKLLINNLDLAALSQQPLMGHSANISATFRGTGLNKQDMNLNFQTRLEQFQFKDYLYAPLQINGNYKENKLALDGQIDDINLAMDIRGHIDMGAPKIALDFDANLRKAYLKALEVTSDSVVIRGQIIGNMVGLAPQDFEGYFQLDQTTFSRGGENHTIDRLELNVVSHPERMDLTINSKILTLDFHSNFDFTVMPTEMKGHFNNYFRYDPGQYDGHSRNFNMTLNIIDPEILVDMISRDLTELGKGSIKANYQSQGNQLKAEIDLPLLQYKDLRLDGLTGEITSNESNLNYAFSLHQVENSKFAMLNPQLRGTVKNDSIYNEFLIKDSNDNTKYRLGSILTLSDSTYYVHILPDEVMLNYQSWRVSSDNLINITNGRLNKSQLVLSDNGQRIALSSILNEAGKNEIKLDFTEFDLGTLSKAVSENQDLISGTINGSVLFKDLPLSMALTSDLTIDQLHYSGSPIGDVDFQVSNDRDPILDVVWKITGTDNNGNQVQGKGSVSTGTSAGNELNMDVQITHINLASIEGFLRADFSDLSGSLGGNLSLRGPVSQPEVKGILLFKNSRFKLNRLNAYYQLQDERVELDARGIHFNSLQLRDSVGNAAVINGVILTDNYKEYRFDLQVNAKNFTIMNTRASLDSLYFGHLIVDTDIIIKGDHTLPIITANVVVNKGSEFTLVIPQENYDPTGADQIVEFADMEAPDHSIDSKDTVAVQSKITGVSFNANINVDQGTKIKVIVDPLAGDHLEITGKGYLSFGFDPSGKISMSGRYEAEAGSYQLTFYNFIRRKFDISPGSSIIWSGDPVNAAIDINAIYEVRAQPYDLVRTSLTEAESQAYRRPLSFEVDLHLTGQLLQPTLDFEIALPSNQGNAQSGLINTRLAQINREPAERNKQVFALLLLSRFISDTPGSIGQTDVVTTNVVSSVSQLVSQQLNALAGQYIKGINLNFDLQTYGDYSSGQSQIRTSLQLELSKQFFEDRLIVTVGSSLDLSGTSQDGANGIPGDFSVEYLLTSDGRYRLKGFSSSAYEGVIDGELTTTGIALIFTRDYNKLQELFRKQQLDSLGTRQKTPLKNEE